MDSVNTRAFYFQAWGPRPQGWTTPFLIIIFVGQWRVNVCWPILVCRNMSPEEKRVFLCVFQLRNTWYLRLRCFRHTTLCQICFSLRLLFFVTPFVYISQVNSQHAQRALIVCVSYIRTYLRDFTTCHCNPLHVCSRIRWAFLKHHTESSDTENFRNKKKNKALSVESHIFYWLLSQQNDSCCETLHFLIWCASVSVTYILL